jgi:hypothetical protein
VIALKVTLTTAYNPTAAHTKTKINPSRKFDDEEVEVEVEDEDEE